ncbi:branched-chain amino acid transport system II carrier protein [Schinkia azotoformans]|uniref:branched-chain amino acid transport system II carrier protein n=1 Tax=Schinkia azotoformans TaxID=1454 RepID=UPI002DBE315F|nr:branched-chain amino acid transport system II carrier protein [Schinkia azotoformans]MEC1637703.1 branched-chain amino acid transport system II carrier protein [Schinkia azotoformans]MEC1944938.1 branched-chain amino acid transport system II carrier protein [Schinkia azotoformans]MED4353849.1 branched-chain amino acid transport system II carrier protein [Schinkia azotoformans]
MNFKNTLSIGLMLFALFFGAGNMIFPPLLGQAAGTNLWPAIIGFLITGVGLPLLGVTAAALNGGDFEKISARVHPMFGIIFTLVLYLSIGPVFAIPRTGTVAFEISVIPFLNKELASNNASLFLYTIVFFGVTYWLSRNPSKLVDRIGKVLTPALLITIAVLVAKAIFSPMGSIPEPSEAYSASPFFKGFIEGYLTLDALAALVFAIVVFTAIKNLGITNPKTIAITTIKSGIIAVIALMLVYLSLAYLGATSASVVGEVENGGQILAISANHYYGIFGTIMLGLAITLACLTTSIGLVTSCAEYFNKLWPKISYQKFVLITSVFSMLVANVGLTQLINISLPVLMMIYPIAITLIILSFLDRYFGSARSVYIGGVLGTGIVSILDGFVFAGFAGENVKQILSSTLPLYSNGVGWVVPALIGVVIGYVFSLRQKQNDELARKAS